MWTTKVPREDGFYWAIPKVGGPIVVQLVDHWSPDPIVLTMPDSAGKASDYALWGPKIPVFEYYLKDPRPLFSEQGEP